METAFSTDKAYGLPQNRGRMTERGRDESDCAGYRPLILDSQLYDRDVQAGGDRRPTFKEPVLIPADVILGMCSNDDERLR